MVAKYADYEFYECPVKYRTARAVILSGLGAEGFLQALGPVQGMKLPAKRRAALQYVEQYLVKLKLTQ